LSTISPSNEHEFARLLPPERSHREKLRVRRPCECRILLKRALAKRPDGAQATASEINAPGCNRASDSFSFSNINRGRNGDDPPIRGPGRLADAFETEVDWRRESAWK
jgi:hypothetical protein